MSKKVDEPSRFGGTVNEILGSIKEKTGKVIGNKSMEAKGHMQREMGNAEVEAAKRKKSDKGKMKGPLVNEPTDTGHQTTYTAESPTYSNVGEHHEPPHPEQNYPSQTPSYSNIDERQPLNPQESISPQTSQSFTPQPPTSQSKLDPDQSTSNIPTPPPPPIL